VISGKRRHELRFDRIYPEGGFPLGGLAEKIALELKAFWKMLGVVGRKLVTCWWNYQKVSQSLNEPAQVGGFFWTTYRCVSD
jgi:hypothetical protein